jgi:hypothetical protein
MDGWGTGERKAESRYHIRAQRPLTQWHPSHAFCPLATAKGRGDVKQTIEGNECNEGFTSRG